MLRGPFSSDIEYACSSLIFSSSFVLAFPRDNNNNGISECETCQTFFQEHPPRRPQNPESILVLVSIKINAKWKAKKSILNFWLPVIEKMSVLMFGGIPKSRAFDKGNPSYPVSPTRRLSIVLN